MNQRHYSISAFKFASPTVPSQFSLTPSIILLLSLSSFFSATAAVTRRRSSMDPKSGYSSATKTYPSLRPDIPLPPENSPLSVTDYVFSLLSTADDYSPSATVLIDASTGASLSYSDLLRRVDSLSFSLSSSLSSGDVAFILCPSSLHIPVIYLSLLSLGVVVSPANPISTQSELAHLVGISRPTVIFTVSSMASTVKSFGVRTVFVDSPEFDSMLARRPGNRPRIGFPQSSTAAILYSSGTTGRVKGVELTHRNLIALIAGFKYVRTERKTKNRPICLLPIPLFHVFGFFMLFRAVSLAETMVVMPRFDFEKMLVAIEKFRVNYMPVSPPLVVALAKSELVDKYDLSSLESLGCGGAPLGKEVAIRFQARFPDVELTQGYGMTETAGAAARTLGPEECERYGSVGRLAELFEAKIVDPSTGEALPPGQRGELWLRGPMIMKGYVGDKEATAGTFSPDGWLKTGDLCYFDSDGFLYIVDRLKELIKYKGYQVPPAELERLLLYHPEIADAAVVPYPDEEAGQIPMAFVVRKPGSTLTESQVMDYVAKQVSPYKRIRRVAFVNNIPKNPSGKILRRELVSRALSSRSRL